MLYMLLIHGAEEAYADKTEEEMGALVAEYERVAADLEEAGAMVSSHRLRPVETATTLRERDGELLVTDGPFAETKEQLGGYYLIDVADLDAAIAWARRLPSVRTGCVEVRPVWEM